MASWDDLNKQAKSGGIPAATSFGTKIPSGSGWAALNAKAKTATPAPRPVLTPQQAGGSVQATALSPIGNTGSTPQITQGTDPFSEIAQRITDTLGREGKGLYEDTKKTILHPIQAFKDLNKETQTQASDVGKNLFNAADKLRNAKTTSDKIAYGLDTVQAVVGAAFSPVGILFNVANKIPGINVVSRIGDTAVGIGGDIVGPIFKQTVDALPLPPDQKEKFSKRADELGQLIGALTVGGALYAKGEGILDRVTGNDLTNQIAKANTPEKVGRLLDGKGLSDTDKTALSERLVGAKSRDAVTKTFEQYAKEQADYLANDLRAGHALMVQNEKALQVVPGQEVPGIDFSKVKVFPEPTVPGEAPTVPDITRTTVTKKTALEKGDVVSLPDVGRFIVSDIKTKVLPEGKEQVYILKDSAGNLLEEPISSLIGFSRETKAEKIVSGTDESIPATPQSSTLTNPSTQIQSPTTWDSLNTKAKQSKSKTNTDTNTGTAAQTEPVQQSTPTQSVERTPQTPQKKTAGLAENTIERAVENGLKADLADLPEYKTVNHADQAVRALELVRSDPQLAQDIISGKRKPPDNLLVNAVFRALEEVATREGDVQAINELARSKATTMTSRSAQELGILGSKMFESPVDAIKDIIKTREEALKERKTDITKETKSTIEDIKTEIRDKAPTKQAWSDFVESLKC